MGVVAHAWSGPWSQPSMRSDRGNDSEESSGADVTPVLCLPLCEDDRAWSTLGLGSS